MGANVRALSTLVDDLFELSRLDAGDYAWSTEAVPLAQLVDEALLAIRAQAERHRVALRSDVAGSPAPRAGEPGEAAAGAVQPAQNAIRHTPPDGSVQVRAQQLHGSVEIEVADTGLGIAEADLPHVFEPFYRGGRRRRARAPAAALALPSAGAIVEAHGGRIWLADAMQGTRVLLHAAACRGLALPPSAHASA